MKTQINEIKRMQQLDGLINKNQEINEIKKSEVLPQVIKITEQAVKEGNTSDFKALKEKIAEELNIKTQSGSVYKSVLDGMKYILVGSPIDTICIIVLADKSEYVKELDSESSKYTKIKNWWVRAW